MTFEMAQKELEQGLADNFWDLFLKDVGGRIEDGSPYDVFSLGGRKVDPRDRTPRATIELLDETLRRVRSELGTKAALAYAKPTLFHQLFFESLMVHSAAVKRERLPRILPEYNVEGDIASTEKQARDNFENMYRTELAFIRAREARHFDKAEAHLRSIEIVRADETGPEFVEVLSWRMELAVDTGNVAMFLEAFGRIPSECTFCPSFLKESLNRLIMESYVAALGVTPSMYGMITAVNPPACFQPFVDAMFKMWIEAVAQTLCETRKMTEGEFRLMIGCEFEKKRVTFLRVTPQLVDIAVQWR